MTSLIPEEKRLLKNILKFAQSKKVKLYLVGGILRDLILNRAKENPDFDFCLKKGAIGFGKRIARKFKTGFVVLDKKRGCCRLVKTIKDKTSTLDFTDFRGRTLEEDLKKRDFTINALGIELDKILQNKNWDNLCLDPYGGRKDLKAKIIRIVNKNNFDADPLRMLRAFSLAAIFGFKIDKETLRLIKLKRDKILKVSPERLRDELFKILDQSNSYKYLLEMDKLKMLKLIIPEIEIMRDVRQGPYHHLDVWQHTLETVGQLEGLIQELKNNSEIQNYLAQTISSGRKRSALIKLGALLHDIGKPQAKHREDGKTKFHGHEKIGLEISKNITQRLKLSNDERDALEKIVLWHLRPGYLADNEKITPRATFRYFRDTGTEGVSILLLSIADQRSTKGPLTSKNSRLHHEKVVLSLIKEYFKRQKTKKLPRLITGDDLIERFDLSPSPLIGKILREVEELQAVGKIKSKKEACAVAQEVIGTKR